MVPAEERGRRKKQKMWFLRRKDDRTETGEEGLRHTCIDRRRKLDEKEVWPLPSTITSSLITLGTIAEKRLKRP